MPSTWTPSFTVWCMGATGLLLCGRGVPLRKPLLHPMEAGVAVVFREAVGVLQAAVVVPQLGLAILQVVLGLQVVLVIGGVMASQVLPPQVLPLVELGQGKVGGR